ncbi:GIY-YIG nuclease family protein [bacterium]|jgi:putative endonuclease|nr:GIY-YIG nuclease family protein [bacterium]MBT3581367.1 GIY-YIG nuclease family protein [bacterium]MBT4551360.1 GIY-YIG nuclease family protein [bacterium]MBT5988203.1 GIY-YIG nuclease family protein [bacterium]MBT7088253.1 GIY-YIG nuclease family protein [bacterium]
MWYTYILESQKDNKLYIGSTNNLERRINQHNSGEVLSTKARRPFTLLVYVANKSERIARQLERYFKSGSGKAFVYKRLLVRLSSEA